MQAVVYRPADITRWLQTGARQSIDRAKRAGVSIVRREGERSIKRDLKEAAGAVLEAGKGALKDFAHRRLEELQYSLTDDGLEVQGLGSQRRIQYSEIKSIEFRRGDRAVLVLERGSLAIKPVAHLVSGRLKVPIGWERNGIEVPFELLIEELAVRAGIELVVS